jgi:hypothetical protein
MRKNRFLSKFRFLKLTLGLSVLIVGTFCALSVASDSHREGKPFKLIYELEQRVHNLEQQSTASGIEVYDAAGQFLGFVSSYEAGSESISVYLPLDERVINIKLTDGELTHGSLYFMSSDCSGDPYISAAGTYGFTKNLGKYYIGEKSIPSDILTGSMLAPWNSPPCNRDSFVRALVSAQEVAAPIALPVALPLSFRMLE